MKFTLNDIIAVKRKEELLWHRARIIKIILPTRYTNNYDSDSDNKFCDRNNNNKKMTDYYDSDTRILCEFLDTMEKTTTKITYCKRIINDEIKSIEPLARRCSLFGIEPSRLVSFDTPLLNHLKK